MATTNPNFQGQFSRDLRRLLKMAGDNADEVARKTVLQVGKRLVDMSPVGDPTNWKNPAPKGYVGGRFRGNWQHGFNLRPGGVLDTIDPSGEATKDKIEQRVMATQGAGGIHFFVNNLPYANRLEYGWSKQAPAGMVGLTAQSFHEFVLKEAAAARAKGRATV